MGDNSTVAVYFKEPGESNTDAVIDLVAKRVNDLGIDTVKQVSPYHAGVPAL